MNFPFKIPLLTGHEINKIMDLRMSGSNLCDHCTHFYSLPEPFLENLVRETTDQRLIYGFPEQIFEKVSRERALPAVLRARSVPNNATRFLVLFRDLSARFWMEISLLNTSKTITTLDMKKDFVDKIYLSVQERKSWCFICCWNTSDLESILNRLHPDILQLWIWQNMN